MNQYVRNLAISFLLGILVLSLISSDVIMPGYKSITITNKITNIDDFPNYVFILGCPIENPTGSFVEVQFVAEDGTIPNNYYKLSNPSVFAIEKSKWDKDKMAKFMDVEDIHGNQEIFEEYNLVMKSMGAKEVIKDLDNVMQIPETSAKESEVREFSVNLQDVKVDPDNIDNERNYLKYLVYIGIPLIALVFIILKIKKKI